MKSLRVGLTKAHDDIELKKPLSQLSKLGFNYVSHAVISPYGDCTTLFSHNKWGEIYTGNKLNAYDPCVRYLFNTNKTMIPWRNMTRDWRKLDVMEERNRICGIKDGLSIYSRDKTGTRFIIALGYKNKDKVENFLLYPPLVDFNFMLKDLFKAHQVIINRSCW